MTEMKSGTYVVSITEVTDTTALTPETENPAEKAAESSETDKEGEDMNTAAGAITLLVAIAIGIFAGYYYVWDNAWLDYYWGFGRIIFAIPIVLAAASVGFAVLQFPVFIIVAFHYTIVKEESKPVDTSADASEKVQLIPSINDLMKDVPTPEDIPSQNSQNRLD